MVTSVETLLENIPDSWNAVRLKDVVAYEKNSLDPQSFPDEQFDYYSIPAYAENGKPIIEVGEKIHSQKLEVKRGTVLFGKINPRVAKVWHVVSNSNRRKIASTEFIPLVALDELSTEEFVYYLMWSDFVLPKSQELVSGSTPSRQRVDVRAFLDIEVPLPPLPEQRAIAQVLNTVRRSIAATEQVIAAARELKRSLMKYLFTYGPVPVDQADQVTLKETEVGEVPEGWEVKPLGSINNNGGSIQTGPFGSLLHASDYVPSGVPFVMPKDLTDDAKISIETIANIGNNDFQRLERYHLQTGDVVTARRGEIGRRALVTENENGWVCGTGCLRIRSGEELDPKFLTQALGTTHLRTWLLDHAVGSTMPNLSSRVLESLPFPFPELGTQELISKSLCVADKKISAETEQKSALESLFASLLHHLMTGKVRVKPTPTPP